MPLWFLLTVIGLFCVALADLSQKVTLKGSSPLSSITNNFLVWNFIGIISLIYFLLRGFPVPSVGWDFFLKLVPLSIVYFLGGTFYYQSFKSNSVSISAVLVTISSVFTTILGIIFYHESASWPKLVGSIIVLSAIFIVNYQKKVHFDKYNLYALLGGIFYGIAYTADKYFIISTSPEFYQIILCFAVGLTSIIFRPRQIVTELRLFKKSLIPSIISAIVLFFLYQKFLFWAISVGGEVGRIDVLNNATIFIIIFVEYFIFKESKDIPKKLLAATIASIGATILAVAK